MLPRLALPALLGLLPSPVSAQVPLDPVGPSLAAARPVVGVTDHVYSYWPVNYRPWATWGTNAKVRYVNSGTYGLCFDTSIGEVTRLGYLANPGGSAEGSLALQNDALEALPELEVAHDVLLGGSAHLADSFLGPGGDANTPSRLIDGGRFMQRVDIPEVGYSSAPELAGSVQLATMPRHLVLTHRTTSSVDQTSGVTARMHLSGPAVDALTQVSFPATSGVTMIC